MRVAEVDELAGRLEAMLAGFEPRTCEGSMALRLVESLARLERLAVAAKTLALGQVERTRAWAHDGTAVRSPAEWLAAKTGVPRGEAIRDTDTARCLESLPATADALRQGRLSAPQAREITTAAVEAPDAEADLLALVASGRPFTVLREEARRVKAAAQDDAERAERQRSLRRARRFTDAEGMRRYDVALTPEQAATFEPAWDTSCNQVFDAARRDGLREPLEAYAADALVLMAETALAGGTGDASGKRNGNGSANVHALLLVDAPALRRGHTEAGETCEIAGIGPIDVAAARHLLGDATIDILAKDGIDVRTVAHVGRAPNSRQRAALLADWQCEIRGCAQTRRLEIDHIEPWSEGGSTGLDNLGPKCRFHHHLKTHQGWRDGPRGDDAKRDLIPPDDPDPPRRT